MDKKPTRRSKSGSADETPVTKTNLKDHKRKFSCNFCGLTLSQKYKLTNHIRVHTREKPYKCKQSSCQANFATKENLKQHQLVHIKADESFLKFKCSICQYKSSRKFQLVRHLRTHSDVKEFSCDLCPYGAKHKQNIKSHQKQVHSTEKLFKCPQPGCQYSCKTKSDLKKHLPAHSNDQPFVCSVANCDFKSKWKTSLTYHEMAHRGEKPFKCSFCTFSCTMTSHLVDHIRIHTGEAPHPCQSCSYRAKTSSQLIKHLKRIHRGEKVNAGTQEAIPNQLGMKTSRCKVAGCDFATRKKSKLAIHLNAAHTLPRVVLEKL